MMRKILFIIPLLLTALVLHAEERFFITKWDVARMPDKDEVDLFLIKGFSASGDFIRGIETDRDIWWQYDQGYKTGTEFCSIKREHRRGAHELYVKIPERTIRNIKELSIYNRELLLEVVDWGGLEVDRIKDLFRDCVNLKISPSAGSPRFRNGAELDHMFLNCRELDATSINHWDVSQVVSMNAMFMDCTHFNSPLNRWDVSNVVDFEGMFAGCTAFNQPIEQWNLKSAKKLDWMFYKCERFNQPLNRWDVSHVTSMRAIFANSAFNQPINAWDVSQVTDMWGMFRNTIFNQPLEDWDVSKVDRMGAMFYSSQFNRPIGNWDVSNVEHMEYMFEYSVYNHPLNRWNVANVVNMNSMFASSRFDQHINNWNVQNVRDMSFMFWNSDFNKPIDAWDVSGVTRMQGMFGNSEYFNQPLNAWSTRLRNVRNMAHMFYGAVAFNQPINQWDVGGVQNFHAMFAEAKVFNQPLNRWNVSAATDLDSMFYNAQAFNQSLGSWRFQNGALLGIQRSGIDAENYARSLQGWNENAVANQNVKIDATNLLYTSEAKEARTELRKVGKWTFYNDNLVEQYVVFKDKAVETRKGSIVTLKMVFVGITPREQKQLQISSEPFVDIQFVDPTTIRLRYNRSGTVRFTATLPATGEHDELQASCTVTAVP